MDMETKICVKCKEQKQLSEYNKRKTSQDGLDNRCRVCVNARRRNLIRGNPKHIEAARKYRKHRQDFINEAKSKGCEICGYKKCTAALVFHHRDPSTKVDTISNMACRCASVEDIRAEMDKCTLLCQNCHHELHISEGNMGLNKSHRDC
jgi:hypothetical protein